MMDNIYTFTPDTLIHAVGWALIHSLWLGAGIALVLAMFLRAFPGLSSRTRYLMSCAALTGIVGLTLLACFYYIDPQPTPLVVTQSNALPLEAVSTPNDAPPLVSESLMMPATQTDIIGMVDRYLPWIVFAWLSGIAVVSCRLLCGWVSLRRLCYKGASPVSTALQSRVVSLCQSMRVRCAVRVLESARAVTPMVVGWVRPVILLPASCITGLSPQQLEAVLAHELAHVLRRDYLVNLLQCMAETLLFYHPAVWWIGRVIRQERERCCDELAVRVSGDRVDYARALLHIAESTQTYRGRLSLASQGGDLAGRVRRLLGHESYPASSRWAAGLWTTLASLTLACVFVGGALADSDGESGAQTTAQTTEAETDTASGGSHGVVTQRIIDIPYQKLVEGDPAYNVVIRPGDAIKIITAVPPRYVYIQGEVARPGAYTPPGDNKLTLKQLIASAGGVTPGGKPKYVKLVRRLAGDKEQITELSADDLNEGWVQDMFLAPNDLVILGEERAPEDKPAKERRLIRGRLRMFQHRHMEARQAYDAALTEHGDKHPIVVRLEKIIETLEKQMVTSNEQLRPEEGTVMEIIPAPESEQPTLGAPPRAEDLVTTPLPNTAQPGHMVNVFASNGTRRPESTKFVRRLGTRGHLYLPGIGQFPFVGRPISEIESDILARLQGLTDYARTDHVTIVLPNTWLFSAMGTPPAGGKGVPMYAIPRADFRLRDALSAISGLPDDAQTIRVIRQRVVKVEE